MGLVISIFGLGYVGSVSAACFAHLGHKVIGVDVSQPKVQMLADGKSPIIEAQMSELVTEAHASGRLRATTDPATAIADSDITFVCVGTPSLKNGKLNLSHVEHVAAEIGAVGAGHVEADVCGPGPVAGEALVDGHPAAPRVAGAAELSTTGRVHGHRTRNPLRSGAPRLRPPTIGRRRPNLPRQH